MGEGKGVGVAVGVGDGTGNGVGKRGTLCTGWGEGAPFVRHGLTQYREIPPIPSKTSNNTSNTLRKSCPCF